MNVENRLKEIERALQAKSVYEVGQIARAVGIMRATDEKKAVLIARIMSIANGEAEPEITDANKPRRGAPAKSAGFDRELVSEIQHVRIQLKSGEDTCESVLSVASGEQSDSMTEGIISYTEDGAILRAKNGGSGNIIAYIGGDTARSLNLREGDEIKCNVVRREGYLAGVSEIYTINGLTPYECEGKATFESFTPCYPSGILSVADMGAEGKVFDMFCPVMSGQRAMLSLTKEADDIGLILKFSAAISLNERVIPIILLADARPEDVTCIKRSAKNAAVFSTTFDEGWKQHCSMAKLAVEYAKRKAESGLKPVLFIDDLNKLVSAFSAESGNFLSGCDGVKKLLVSAVNTVEGASLTVISVLRSEEGCGEKLYSHISQLFNMQAVFTGAGLDVLQSRTERVMFELPKKVTDFTEQARLAIDSGKVTYQEFYSAVENSGTVEELINNYGKYIKL